VIDRKNYVNETIPITPSGIELATFRLVAQCLNQLRPRRFILYLVHNSVLITNLCFYSLDLQSHPIFCRGPGSVASIATGYGLDGPGIESRWGRDFPHLSRPALGPHPASCTMGKVKGKAISLQAWTGPEGSRRLRLPDFKTVGT
jgi:hypothetical protein